MDADVAELVREDRLLDAARLSSTRGDAAGASLLFERACDWRRAALEALAAGDAARGLELALRAGDDALAHEAVKRLADDVLRADRIATRLAEHGRSDWAARVLEGVGRDLDAARAWERAGAMTRAASLYERAKEPARAARVLEAALRRDGRDGAAAVALGALLGRFGKDEASLRALQRVPPGTPERAEALRLMVEVLDRLGLEVAAGAAATELATLAARANPNAPTGADVPEREAPAWLHGRYEVVRQVASSATARVLEAIDRARGERVALKVFGSGATAREVRDASGIAFDRLARDLNVLRALDHPAIVPIRDVYVSASTVVFGWMAGGTLEQRIAAGPLAPAHAVEIASTVLAALGEAHRVGILHRDIKAANVLFDAAGAARLTDFGAAHAADASATVTAGDLGALAYQSPEQREGRAVTRRSDLFSVGVLLAEMLTGRRGSAASDAWRPSEAVPRLDDRHDRVVASLLAQTPEERPTDALQARERLRSLPWPDSAAPAGALRQAKAVGDGADAPEQRLHTLPDGRFVDTWTGRAVECIPLTDDVLARARVFATVDLAVLQPILRIDREGGRLWLAACAAPLGRLPSAAERPRLEAALEALRAKGLDPAPLDATRLAIDAAGNVVVRF